MRHNFLALASAVVIITAGTAQAQQVSGFVESYNTVSGAETTPQLNTLFQGPLDGKFGWSFWTLTSKPYSEAYMSLTFAPAKWVELSTGVGLESAGDPLRFGHSLWLGKGRWSFLTIHEHGRDGADDYWFRYLGKFRVTKSLSIGMNSTRFLGTGPYAEQKFGKATLWGTYAVGEDKGVAGLRLNF